ncbi:MAG: L-seryl-tRNA(Sec) selenium transferase [Spirochaetaceae bacterium]|nr:MAG: L-seryl-tRNA(Sec) selenium transferase [Spirochaetaceae bacterium]
MNKSGSRSLARLPQIEKLLQSGELTAWFSRLSRPLVARLTAETIEEVRATIQSGEDYPGIEAILQSVIERCREMARRRIHHLINATGVMLHTNLGRAPISKAAWRSAEAVNTGFSNLELDLQTGKRGKRRGIIPDLLSLLVGAQDALMVNNNAAAVFLILSALGKGREVIVSRGEQVQIGGGFRIPEILAQTGARMMEVGTTNITHLEDYTGALSSDTAMILIVHASNFRIRGFTARPEIRELAAALPEGVLLVVDQGSGTTTESIPGEQSVSHYLKSGAHLVSFSGDKVLGGPQAGFIVGKRDLIQELSRHPLNRVIRPGKTIYSLMEEALIARLNRDAEPPVEAVLKLSMEELRTRGESLLAELVPDSARLVESSVTTGGGSAPDECFPSLSIELQIRDKAQILLAELRRMDPPIIATIEDGRVLLNLATLLPEELPQVAAALKRLLTQKS